VTSNTPGASWRRVLAAAALGLALGALHGCGGGGGNPLGNPPLVTNAPAAGQSLSFAYFQRCVDPIFEEPLAVGLTCANAACHDNATGHGGAFRVIPLAQPVDVTANAPDVIRTTPMYRNFLSALGEVIIGAPTQSLLINKPLVRNVLHGGGLIFPDATVLEIRTIETWIGNPMPAGQDEFSVAGYSLFTTNTSLWPNGDPINGTCIVN